jgi:UDP-glucose 4-epimerase
MAEAIEMPQAYNQVFNIGADQPYTINDLATAVAQAMDVEAKILHVPARNEVINAYSSHEKVQRVFGARKLHSLEQGLCQMAQWVKQHGARTSQKFDHIEVEKNFPKAWLA